MGPIDLRVDKASIEGLDGPERLEALQEPFYTEWSKRGSGEQARLELLGEATPDQRVLITTWWVEREVADGGLAAVCESHGSRYFHEIAVGLDTLRAYGHLRVLHRGVQLVYMARLKAYRRDELLEDVPDEAPAFDDRLEQLEDAWRGQEVNVEDLLLELVRQRPEGFVR